MRFTFRQLEVFVEAAQDCNFRKTADRLGISQPSISNQIRVLERWAGGPLFLRSRGSTPRLSRQGAAFIEQAQQLLASGRQLHAQNIRRVEKERLRLTVAAGPYLLDHCIRPALPRFLAEHDDLVLDFLPPGAAHDMHSAVRSGEADIAVFTGSRAARRLAGAELVCETPCAIHGKARFARLAAKDPEAVSAMPFILPLEGSSMERWTLATLKKAGISPVNVVARSQFADVMADMVADGRGVAVLFEEHMAPYVRANSVQRLPVELESGSRVIVTGPKARGRAAGAFLQFLQRVLRRDGL